MSFQNFFLKPEYGPEKFQGAIRGNWGESMGNCGLTLITDVSVPPGFVHPENSRERGLLYALLAKNLNLDTNYVFSDNIYKGGWAYGEPVFKMDDPLVSTAGFVGWLIRNEIGRISASSRMANSNHIGKNVTSIIQLWVWTPPTMLENEEWIVNEGYVEASWLRGRQRILKRPEKLKVQPVSTKW